MAKKCDHTYLTLHSGTEQSQRRKTALQPEHLKLNDFGIEEWMEFAFNFAKELNYFPVDNDITPSGDWQNFLIQKEAISTFVSLLETSQELTPHLTLFVTFLKLLDFSNDRFNKLTQRHLDFYYGKILQIQKQEAQEDQVHLLFELAKNAEEILIEKATKVEAGKDVEGHKVQFATQEDRVFNKAKITAIKNVLHHRKTSTFKPNETNGIYATPMTNSKDGVEEALETGDTFLPFGYPTHHHPEVTLPSASLGFAIAAPTLSLQEGRRLIKVSFTFKNPVGGFDLSTALDSISVYATGEKEWLGPFILSETIEPGFSSSLSGKKLTLAIEVDKTIEAIIPYQKLVHEGNYNTSHPLLTFHIHNEFPNHEAGYGLYTHLLEKELNHIEITTEVSGVTDLSLRNDQGTVVPDKPFYPFGTQPLERSAFYISYDELFSKHWETLSLEGTWLNTPNNFRDHYLAYRKDGDNFNLSPLLYHQTMYYTFEGGAYKAPTSSEPIKTATFGPTNLYVDSDDYFTAKVSITDEKNTEEVTAALPLFGSKSDGVYSCQLTVNNSTFTTGKNGPLKWSLNKSFLHSLYPKIYALALSSEEDTLIPNAPYTPVLEQLTLSYTATQEWDIKNEDATENIDCIQLFHLHPFGISEEKETLLPTYCKGGELYIGLENVEPLQQITLLFQFLEGTENPLAKAYQFPEKMEWAILSNNAWETLDSNHLLGNTTDNFLKTGLVTVTLPKGATSHNTLLPSGYFWLRAKTDKNFDAFCQCLNIHAQAVTAAFINQNNELSHLENGLPAGTITKLTQRNALIKSVGQPYASFGGRPKESSESYYTRVSERIRHRDRAVNQWDYEHLILQQFKDIYKVKCLNHTKGDNYHAPGHVALVVIPDIVNNNAFDIYQPRVSTAKRNEIQQYVNALNTFFVDAEVINPDYEEVKITTSVRFRKGYDENYYTGVLESAIKQYLSPWAFSETNELNFGITFHRSKIIQYLEQLEYVDYLEDVVVEHRKDATAPYESKTNVQPSSPKAILVSAKQHEVYAIGAKCESPITKTKTECLP